MGNPLRLCLVAGTRPNFMKVAPLLSTLLQRPDRFDPMFVHTGQHYDDEMARVFFEDLKLKDPDYSLDAGSGSHGQQTGRILSAFESVLMQSKPDAVVVVGDVNSTLACALAAAKLLIPVAHVEAGLRSRDRSMPEEINRILTDRLSAFLFTTCPEADDNLLNEGAAKDSIHRVGNIMIESILRVLPRVDRSGIHLRLGVEKRKYGLITLHRPGNVDDAEALPGLLDAFERIAGRIPMVFPVHPRTRKRMEEFGLPGRRRKSSNLKLIEPAGYLDFLALERDAELVVTDSGGIQEETTFFQVPCLTVRPNTERGITVTMGTNVLVGTDPKNVLKEAYAILDGKKKTGAVPQLWDEGVSGRIADILQRSLGREREKNG